MTTIDRAFAVTLQNEVTAALKAIAEKHGLTITGNRATFAETEIKFSATLSQQQTDGVNATYALNWTRYHRSYGFDATDLGRTFRSGGRDLKIVGLDIKRRKYPVACQDQHGKIALFVAADVLRLIGKAPDLAAIYDLSR